MATAGYRIADEPIPGGLAHLTVNPVWCLFAVMFGGVWLSWPWFLLNAKALGSPTLRRDVIFIVLSALGVAGLAFGGLLIGAELFRYYAVVLIAAKLVVSYRIFISQSRSFEIYSHFDGAVRNGMLVVAAGFFLRGRVLPEPDSLWSTVLLLVMS